jgi:hypothetical protein
VSTASDIVARLVEAVPQVRPHQKRLAGLVATAVRKNAPNASTVVHWNQALRALGYAEVAWNSKDIGAAFRQLNQAIDEIWPEHPQYKVPGVVESIGKLTTADKWVDIQHRIATLQSRLAALPVPTVTPEIQAVLDDVLKRWNGRGATFRVELFVKSRDSGHPRKAIDGARLVLTSQGWKLRDVNPGSSGVWWDLTAPAALVAERHEARVVRFDGIWVPLAVELDPEALRLKTALYSPVAGELWVFPAGADPRTKLVVPQGPPYRVPRNTQLPAHYVRDEPPDWIALLPRLEWVEYRDFSIGKTSALQLCAPFTPKDGENRYGLSGVAWSGSQFAVTDGNQLHVVHVPDEAPQALRDGFRDYRTFKQKTLGAHIGSRDVEQFNLTASRVLPLGKFPDYRQVVPYVDSHMPNVTVDPAGVKRYEAALKFLGRGESRLQVKNGRFTLQTDKKDIGDVDLGLYESFGQNVWTYVDPKLFLKAMTPFKTLGETVTIYFPATRGGWTVTPIKLVSSAQMGVVMPLRGD